MSNNAHRTAEFRKAFTHEGDGHFTHQPSRAGLGACLVLAAAPPPAGETLQPVTPRSNRSLRDETRADRLTVEPGAVLLREIMEASGIIEWTTARLVDPRRQEDVTHDLASLLRATVLLAAQGWRDHDDANAVRQDPAMRVASSSSAGLTPLVVEQGLASQPTLSRFTAIMAQADNLKALRDGVLQLAARGLRAENAGRKRPPVTLDVDSLPIEVHATSRGRSGTATTTPASTSP